MAEALWLVTRNDNLGRHDRDGIKNVLINSDDGKTAAVVMQDAVDLVNAQLPPTSGEADKLPVGYFDTAEEVGDLVAGPIRTDGDGYIMGASIAELVT